MSESRGLLIESAERVFASVAAGEAFEAAWAQVRDLGFEGVLVSEEEGGFGGDWGDVFALLRCAGSHALALPLGEAIVSRHLASEAGLACDPGFQTLAERSEGVVDAQGRFSGRLRAAPWGRHASAVLFDHEGCTASVAVADCAVEHGLSPAGEPRDTLIADGARIQVGSAAMSVLEAGAFIRVAQIAGAMDAALAMSIQYANERNQFGKPIGKFQAVQQVLAVFAEEAAVVNCSGQAAARAADRGDMGFEVASAKLRANMAAALGASTAHQVHGAIGFTQDYALHRLTLRLVSWRSEFGGERSWAERIGGDVCARGADAYWPFLTARDDPA